jgi:hypothetical protein
MASDHVRGEMDITHQKDTFDGFMSITVWSSILIVASVLSLTLIFAVGFDWMMSIVAGTALCVAAGMALGMKTNWYITVAVVTVLSLISGGIVSLFSMLFG